MKKPIKEYGNDSLDLKVSADDYESNKDKLKNAAGDTGSITITNDKNKNSNVSGISEDANSNPTINDMINALGFTTEDKPHRVKEAMEGVVEMAIKKLSQLSRPRRKDSSEVDSLYSGADDRRIANESDDKETNGELDDLYDKDEERAERASEYGVKNESNFDSLMSELEKRGVKSINISENVNPRIKKSDLISYLKNKK